MQRRLPLAQRPSINVKVILAVIRVDGLVCHIGRLTLHAMLGLQVCEWVCCLCGHAETQCHALRLSGWT